jgi:hypothetical protein
MQFVLVRFPGLVFEPYIVHYFAPEGLGITKLPLTSTLDISWPLCLCL